MALDDLVTLADVRTFVEPQGDRDGMLQRLLTNASRAVRSHTRRRFTHPPFVGERRFYLQASRYVHTNDPVAGIAYVRGSGGGLGGRLVDGEPAGGLSGQNLEYREPDPEDPEQLLRPRLVLEETYTGPVIVSASFGFQEIPGDVQQAVMVAVSIWFDRDVANTSTTFSLDERRTSVPEALPAQAQDLLVDYVASGAGIG